MERSPRQPWVKARTHQSNNYFTADTFLLAAEVAWKHLDPDTRKAVRATCLDGRSLHDQLISTLCVAIPPPSEARSPPTPKQLRRSLQGVFTRGARPQQLEVSVDGDAEVDPDALSRDEHLLAVMSACTTTSTITTTSSSTSSTAATPASTSAPTAAPGPTIASLRLEGAVPLTCAAVAAISACLPSLRSLALDYAGSWPPAGEDAGEQSDQLAYTAAQLLAVVGPRLRRLVLEESDPWQPSVFHALRHCTSLERLKVSQLFVGTATLRAQSAILYGISSLATLRSLRLDLGAEGATVFGPEPDPRHPPQHDARSLRHLSSLTSLTSLDLNLHHYACAEHTWSESRVQLLGEPVGGVWADLWPDQYDALMSAVRHMPYLSVLRCGHMYLRSEDVAAMPAVEELLVAGVLPQEQQQQQYLFQLHHQQQQQQQQPMAFLPPRLKRLVFSKPPSVHALSYMQPPSSLAAIDVEPCPGAVQLLFGPGDATSDGSRLLPDTHVAARRAVDVLQTVASRAVRGHDAAAARLHVIADAGPQPLLPSASPGTQGPVGGGGAAGAVGGAAGGVGHAAWIRELGPLGCPGQAVVLSGLALHAGDLVCLAHTLPLVQDLALHDCSFPVAALPFVAHLPHLRRLAFDLSLCTGLTRDTVEAALLLALTCAPQLSAVRVSSYPPWMDQVRDAVLRGLGSGGQAGVGGGGRQVEILLESY